MISAYWLRSEVMVCDCTASVKVPTSLSRLLDALDLLEARFRFRHTRPGRGLAESLRSDSCCSLTSWPPAPTMLFRDLNASARSSASRTRCLSSFSRDDSESETRRAASARRRLLRPDRPRAMALAIRADFAGSLAGDGDVDHEGAFGARDVRCSVLSAERVVAVAGGGQPDVDKLVPKTRTADGPRANSGSRSNARLTITRRNTLSDVEHATWLSTCSTAASLACVGGVNSFSTTRRSVGSIRICVPAVYSCGMTRTNITAMSSEAAVVHRIVALPRQRTVRIRRRSMPVSARKIDGDVGAAGGCRLDLARDFEHSVSILWTGDSAKLRARAVAPTSPGIGASVPHVILKGHAAGRVQASPYG